MKWILVLSLALGVSAQAATPFRQCYESILAEKDTPFFEFDTRRFRRLLAKDEWNGEEIIDFLSENPALNRLFRASAGVWQRYTVKVHTLRVYDQTVRQFPYFPDDIQPIPGLTWKSLFKIAIAIHDIGKPVAMERQNKKLHHVLTAHIAERILDALNFTRRQKTFILSLMNHDLIADAIRRRGTIEQTVAGITALAQLNQMSVYDYYRVQRFFFIVDGSSYENVLQLLFRQGEGELQPDRRRLFHRLDQAFGLQP